MGQTDWNKVGSPGREQLSGLIVRDFAFVELSGTGKERNDTVFGGVWSEFCFLLRWMKKPQTCCLDTAGANDLERGGCRGCGRER